jgi:hypothetical protein
LQEVSKTEFENCENIIFSCGLGRIWFLGGLIEGKIKCRDCGILKEYNIRGLMNTDRRKRRYFGITRNCVGSSVESMGLSGVGSRRTSRESNILERVFSDFMTIVGK